MKSRFEPIAVEPHTSWTLRHRPLAQGIPFDWHHYADWALTLILNSRGLRYVGHDMAPYDDGDLVLVAPGVAHSWCSASRIRESAPHIVNVIHFSEAWVRSLAQVCPEMTGLQTLLARARPAVHFGRAAADSVRATIQRLGEQEAPARLVSLLWVLERLSRDGQARRIDATASARHDRPHCADARVRRVIDVLNRRYADTLRLTDLAALACMSVSAFHRTFRKHTQCSAMGYIARLRIGHASRLLVQTDQPVARVAETVGYGSLALFNRQFKALTGVPPSVFRRAPPGFVLAGLAGPAPAAVTGPSPTSAVRRNQASTNGPPAGTIRPSVGQGAAHRARAHWPTVINAHQVFHT